MTKAVLSSCPTLCTNYTHRHSCSKTLEFLCNNLNRISKSERQIPGLSLSAFLLKQNHRCQHIDTLLQKMG